MYKNLRNLLFQKNISVKMYARLLGVSEKTAQNKINKITDFTFLEFKKTCSLFPEYNADYIFAEYVGDDRMAR